MKMLTGLATENKRLWTLGALNGTSTKASGIIAGGQSWQISAARCRPLDMKAAAHRTHSSCDCWCKTTAVKILAQSGEELTKSIQSSDAIGEWWLWWRKNLFSFGHFLKGYPSFKIVLHHPQPGSTKFIQNEHMHMKLGGKVTRYGQGLKGRECRMDLVKTKHNVSIYKILKK